MTVAQLASSSIPPTVAPNTIRGDLIASDTVTLTSGTTTEVAVNARQSDHLLVAYGFESDPGADISMSQRVSWDDATKTHKIEFQVDNSTADPQISYDVFVITTSQTV